jgi:hypothetical protein
MTETFPISPATTKPLWFLGGVAVLLVVVLALLAYTAYSARHSRVEIHGDRLKLVGDLWARSVPIRSLRLEQAEVLDLRRARDYTPRSRRLGTGLPGYASGWFRLRNGEKALVYLTRWDAVLHIPTSLGYSLLLSAERPNELLAALRSRPRG